MAEYIKRDNSLLIYISEGAYKQIQRVPTADVVPARHGWWTDMGDFISCSLCGATRMKEFLCDYGVARRLDVRTNYCPSCGARMDGDGE